MENLPWIHFMVLGNQYNLFFCFPHDFLRLLMCLTGVLWVFSWHHGGLKPLESRTPVTVELPPMDNLRIPLGMVRVIPFWLLLTGLEQMLSIILPGVKCCDIAPEKHLNTSIPSAVVPVEWKAWKNQLVLSKWVRIIKGKVTPSLVFVKAMFTSGLSLFFINSF